MTVGQVLSSVGVVFTLTGIFALDGVSIEYPGSFSGGLGYYFGLREKDRPGQVSGILAVVPHVVSIFVSGLKGPPR